MEGVIIYSVPTGLGCCYNPSLFDLLRRKLYAWHTTITINTYSLAFNQSRIGANEQASDKFNKLNDLFHLINWMLLIRKQMDCTGNCWDTYIGEDEIKKIIQNFHCLGIDVNCVFIDLDIYFKSC